VPRKKKYQKHKFTNKNLLEKSSRRNIYRAFKNTPQQSFLLPWITVA
jgi:hypothetical protein